MNAPAKSLSLPMLRVTGSGLPRVVACPASAVLRHDNETTVFAGRGTVKHKFFSDCLLVGRDEALLLVEDPKLRSACAAIQIEKLPACAPGAFTPELALAYNWVDGTARVLGSNIERAYDEHGIDWSCEIPLSIDVAALTSDGDGVYISDYKTGMHAVDPAWFNWQLKICAVAVARAYDRSYASVEIAYVHEDGDVRSDRADFDALKLALIEGEIREVMERAQASAAAIASGQRPEYALGSQCDWCPCVRSCEPHREVLSVLLTDEGARAANDEADRIVRREIAAADLPTIYQRWRAAERIIGKVGSAIHCHAIAVNGIPISESMVFGPVATSRETIIGDKARPVLIEK